MQSSQDQAKEITPVSIPFPKRVDFLNITGESSADGLPSQQLVSNPDTMAARLSPYPAGKNSSSVYSTSSAGAVSSNSSHTTPEGADGHSHRGNLPAGQPLPQQRTWQMMDDLLPDPAKNAALFGTRAAPNALDSSLLGWNPSSDLAGFDKGSLLNGLALNSEASAWPGLQQSNPPPLIPHRAASSLPFGTNSLGFALTPSDRPVSTPANLSQFSAKQQGTSVLATQPLGANFLTGLKGAADIPPLATSTSSLLAELRSDSIPSPHPVTGHSPFSGSINAQSALGDNLGSFLTGVPPKPISPPPQPISPPINHNLPLPSPVSAVGLGLGVGMGVGVGIGAADDTSWPKPVRFSYSRHLEGSDGLLSGSMMRPPSNELRRTTLATDSSSVSPFPSSMDMMRESAEEIRAKSATPTKSLSPKLHISNVDDRAIENVIASNCQQILMDAAEHMLKAVELANTLRARVGTEVLAVVRERWGGLLSLLERHPDRFIVERIPKNDRVLLVDSSSPQRAKTSPQKPIGGEADGTTTMMTVDEEADGMDLPGLSPNKDGSVAGAFGDHQGASRCLHVGNVPNNFTEVQLMREFEKFGQLDGLKLINQKNGQRRFAFITYKTVEQAITARHCLSKVHPWKSAISFAHKDLLKTKPGVGGSQATASAASGAPAPAPASAGVGTGSGGSPAKDAGGRRMDAPRPGLMPGLGVFPESGSYSHSKQAGMGSTAHHHSPHHQQHQQHQQHPSHQSFPYLSSQRQQSPVSGSMLPAHGLSLADLSLSGSSPGKLGGFDGISTQSREQAILRRLCDDTYVPTQPWPVDSETDPHFCRIVAEQISSFGGTTTISKLRGFLKHRMGTMDNIKSVPLKAMLIAYPQYFRVDGSYVALLATSPSNPASGSS